MKKIVVTQSMEFLPDQRERLESLGDVVIHDDVPQTADEWIERAQGADIICTGLFGFKERWQDLSDIFISMPLVNPLNFDPKIAQERNITLSNSPGCNKFPVAEWVVGMMINLTRELPHWINYSGPKLKEFPKETKSLYGKNITILGKGNIGKQVAEMCQVFGMSMTFFTREDDLYESVSQADFIVDALSSNETTRHVLDKDFFTSLKKGSYFITVTPDTVDVDAMIAALDDDTLAGTAHDAGHALVGNVEDPIYVQLLNHKKVLVTPHIAFNTDRRRRVANDMMIDNIEAYLKGEPINVVR